MKIENRHECARNIEKQLSPIVGRPVEVTFSHLGKEKRYSIAIQTTLYEFSEEDGPLGSMYVTLNVTLLQDDKLIDEVFEEIVNKYQRD
jgi:hypothetical protein|tara:strand:+ start:1219 stop:1485 length:267 start_codon:yes stop_codon:yes gene_type:complete